MDRRQEIARLLAAGAEALQGRPYDAADDLWAEAERDGVDLLLIDAAQRAGAAWPDEARSAARTLMRQAAALAALRDEELERVLRMLAAADIGCLLMKGAALARTHYRQTHLRPRVDSDLLVRRPDLERLVDVLRAAGYERVPEVSGELLTSQVHFDRGDAPGVHMLDVHWRIANPLLFADSLDVDACYQSAVPVPGLASAAALGAPQALLVACVHRIAHHQDDPRLIWLWDIHLLLTDLSADDRTRFVALAAGARMAAVCARSLHLTGTFFHTPGAAALASELRSRASASDEPASHFIGGGLRQVEILSSDLRALPRWRDRTRLLREHLLPPRSYMRAVYPRCPALLLPLAYVHRVARGAAKWFRARS